MPLGRCWEPDRRIQERCLGCIKGGCPCSAPERVKTKQADKAQQGRGTRDMASASVGNGAVEHHGAERERRSSLEQDEIQKSTQSLNELLRDFDVEKHFLEEVHLAFEHLVSQRGQPHLEDAYEVVARRNLLLKVLEDTKANIHNKLGQLEVFAHQFAQMGDKNVAEKAYLRALQVHRSPAFKSSTLHWKLLSKVANFYFEIGEELQGEDCLKQMLELPGILGADRDEIRRKLANSMETTSKTMNSLFLSRATSHHELEVPILTIQTPFPPQHRIMRLANPPRAPADLNELACGDQDIMGTPPLHSAIAAGLPIAITMIHNCADSQLERRDAFARTPLFLAFLFNLEPVAKALIDRFADPEVRRLRMDDMDYCGWSILAVAILSSCSLPFIQLLVENGANVNPFPTLCSNTPLQAAVIKRRPDVVQYLLEHEACPDVLFAHNGLTVREFASFKGYEDILDVLQAPQAHSLPGL